MIIWDAKTGRKVRVLSGAHDDRSRRRLQPGRLAPRDERRHRDHDRLGVRRGRRLFTLRNRDGARGFAGVRFSPDGTLLATEDWAGNLRFWQVASRRLVRTIHTPFGLCDLSFTPDGARIAAADCFGDGATSGASPTGRRLLTLRGHTDVVFSAKFSPDGRRIATASADGTARVWDARAGRPLVTMSVTTTGCRRSSGAPTGGRSRPAASTAQPGSGMPERKGAPRSAGPRGVVDDLEFSPDGRRLVTGSDDGTARIWDVSPQGSRDWATLSADAGGVTSIAYNRAGQRLRDDGQARRDGQALESGHAGRSPARYAVGGERDDAAFTPDGRELVSVAATVELTSVAVGSHRSGRCRRRAGSRAWP